MKSVLVEKVLKERVESVEIEHKWLYGKGAMAFGIVGSGLW